MYPPSRVALVAVVAAVVGALLATRSCRNGGGIETPGARPPAASVAPPTTTAERSRRARADGEVPADEPAKPAPSETQTPAAETKTGVAIEVADEDGKPVRNAAIRLFVADSHHWGAPGIESVTKWSGFEYRPDPGETTFLDCDKEADGIPIKVYGAVDGSPFETIVFTIRAGMVKTVHVVATRPRRATVFVVDAATDRPIPGARVASATETERRYAADLEPLASSIADADGRCVVEKLSAGDHEIEVNADHYLPSKAKWAGADLRVRLEPQEGGAKIVVKVLAPGGAPMPGIAVSLIGTDRVVKTDAAGTAVFADAAPGSGSVFMSQFEWRDAVKAARLPDMVPRFSEHFETHAGDTCELVLGAPPAGTGIIDGRLVGEDGSPIAGISVTLSTGSDLKSVVTDASGSVRFAELPNGEYGAHVSFERNMWFFDSVKLDDGGRASATWTLGSATIRGRVVAGDDRHGVENVTVWFRGPVTGSARSGKDGRFELPNARVGSYSLDAKTETASAAPRNVVVPADAEIVVELITYGRVAVRFLAADRAQLRAAEILLYAAGADRGSKLDPGTGEDDLVNSKLLPGRYEVEVTLGGRKCRFPVDVKRDETSVIEVRVP